MLVFSNRLGESSRTAGSWVIAADTFANRPAIVLTAFARCWLVVDLFEFTFPDITDVQVAGLLVKGKTPGIAQTQGPNLASVAGGLSERVVVGK